MRGPIAAAPRLIRQLLRPKPNQRPSHAPQRSQNPEQPSRFTDPSLPHLQEQARLQVSGGRGREQPCGLARPSSGRRHCSHHRRSLCACSAGPQAMATAADIPALLRRLEGSSGRLAQAQAAKQLGRLAAQGAAACEAIVAAGGIPRLVPLLGPATSDALQAAAAKALCIITVLFPASAAATAAAGAIPRLAGLLNSSSSDTQANAAAVLAYLARDDSERAAAVAETGAIDALVQLLQSPDLLVKGAAADVLCELTKASGQCGAAIAAAGAIPALVRLIPVLHQPATGLLAALVRHSAERREAAAAACAGPALQQELLRGSMAAQAAAAVFVSFSSSAAGSAALGAVAEAASVLMGCLASSDPAVQLRALTALGNLAWDDPPAVAVLLPTGLMLSLQQCLRSSDSALAAGAAWVVNNMAHCLPAEREAIGTAGVVAGLIALLRQDAEIAYSAAFALHALATQCPANQQAVLAAGGFEALLGMLRASGADSDALLKGAAAVALCTLAQGSELQVHAVRAAGAAATIQQALLIWQAGANKVVVAGARAALDALSTTGQVTTDRWDSLHCGSAACPCHAVLAQDHNSVVLFSLNLPL